jgi:hypothetical protein
MATEYAGNAVPAPGFYDGNTSSQTEILYSTQGYTQKGITLKPGIGIIPAGTVMGMVTATKLWVPYNQAASNGTGSDTPRGVLRTGVDTGSDAAGKRFLGNLVITGILKSAALSGHDANALSVLKARTDSVMGTFTF